MSVVGNSEKLTFVLSRRSCSKVAQASSAQRAEIIRSNSENSGEMRTALPVGLKKALNWVPYS